MPSNEERREVAARLRDMANRRGLYGRDVFFANLIDALSMERRTSVGEILERLADLIEPELERTCWNDSLKRGKGVFCCSECGTHLDIADMEEEDMDVFYEPSYCPTCGLKVVRWDAN